MQWGDDYRQAPVVVVAAEAGTLASVTASLDRVGFDHLESARSLGGLRDRIRRGFRGDRTDVLVAVIGADLLDGPDEHEGRAVLTLTQAAGTAVVALTDGPVEAVQTALARADLTADLIVSMDPSQDCGDMAQQIALAASMQMERRDLAARQRDLESEVAELRVMESRLQYMVYHDELTGLSNRRRLKEAVELSVLRARNLHRPCALVLVDVDRFKLVNDLEGYEAGDRLLIEIARMLVRHAKPADTVARIGSDEFVLLLDNSEPAEAVRRAEELQKELEGYRFRQGRRSYRSCVSVGVASLSGDEHQPCASELLARADQACFIAKQHGRNRVEQYSDSHPQLADFRRDYGIAPLIRDALEKDRFFFCFQPIVRVVDGRVTHYECLLRMRGPDNDVFMPSEFIPVAERTGLIHHIDMWVVDRALDFLSELPVERGDVSVSVNLSGHAFHNRDLFELISRRLEMSWVSPTRLVLEITETAAVENLDESREVVARLRALGCRFALDDFGSGFSTFHYIKHFPVDYLKIDGSFIVNLTSDATDQTLVKHMVSIARSLGKDTVAEFVESREAYEMVSALGVDYVQGHFIGRALPEPVADVDIPPRRHRAAGVELGQADSKRDLAPPVNYD